jgi:hypothetical protein
LPVPSPTKYLLDLAERHATTAGRAHENVRQLNAPHLASHRHLLLNTLHRMGVDIIAMQHFAVLTLRLVRARRQTTREGTT